MKYFSISALALVATIAIFLQATPGVPCSTFSVEMHQDSTATLKMDYRASHVVVECDYVSENAEGIYYYVGDHMVAWTPNYASKLRAMPENISLADPSKVRFE
jgi:hypothetical protein